MGPLIRHTIRTVGRNLVLGACLVASFLVVVTFMPVEETQQPLAPPAPTQSRAEVLVERHGCWTGDAPADVEIPGHVVWQHADGRTVYSERLVGPALDTLFGEGNLPGHAVAFCR